MAPQVGAGSSPGGWEPRSLRALGRSRRAARSRRRRFLCPRAGGDSGPPQGVGVTRGSANPELTAPASRPDPGRHFLAPGGGAFSDCYLRWCRLDLPGQPPKGIGGPAAGRSTEPAAPPGRDRAGPASSRLEEPKHGQARRRT